MTSIFFPVSTGCGFLSRVYSLPSLSSAAAAVNAKAASPARQMDARRFIETPDFSDKARVTLVRRRPAKFNGARGRRSWVLDDRDIEAARSELRLYAVELLGIVVGPKPDPIANALVGLRHALQGRFPAGQGEPGLEVFRIGFIRECAGLQPEAIARLHSRLGGLGGVDRRTVGGALWRLVASARRSRLWLVTAGKYLVEVEAWLLGRGRDGRLQLVATAARRVFRTAGSAER